MIKQVENKKITVLGAARSGIAAARLLKNFGADVFVSDLAKERDKAAQADELKQAAIPFEFGRHSDRVFEADFVVLSPGIPVASSVVRKLIKMKVPVYSEIEAASWFCRSQVIAVTGSNGKTTTTTLIGEMLKRAYPDAIVAGNIGRAFSEYVADSQRDSWAVVEVSSFQLETIDTFHPRQAVVLNFAPNHLDRYERYEQYLQAKWRVTMNLAANDILIYNAADEKLSGWVEKVQCRKQGFDKDGDLNQAAAYSDGKILLNGKPLIDVKDMHLKGIHNYMNAMAAALAAANAGVASTDIRAVLADFKGVEHRLEPVAEIDGVKYINDSKATTVESLSCALQSFEAPIVLIAGGKDKGSDFSGLNTLIEKNVKEIILIGVSAEKISESWQGIKPLQCAASLKEAVQKAAQAAEVGDVVLLSPACASFDMFSDFEDRGRQFKRIVMQLNNKARP